MTSTPARLVEPKILFLDIETAPIMAAIWQPYEANAVWVERDTFILAFAAKWSHKKQVKTWALPDYSLYRRDKFDDRSLIKDLWGLLDEADVVVAHNGDAFDIKKINARFIVHKLNPPTPYKTIDTLKISRQAAKFDSNKLDNIGRYTGEGRKIPNTGAALWRGCYWGDSKSWRAMRRYNAQDVLLLESVYHRLRPWAKSHPVLTAYAPRLKIACPTCLSGDVHRRGWRVAKFKKSPRFQCQGCGHWFSQ